MLIVRDPQIAPAGSIPVAEEDGERAPSGTQGRRIGVARLVRSDQEIVTAGAGLPTGLVEFDVCADRKSREFGRSFPCGAEPGGPSVSAVVSQVFVGALEAAITETAEENVLPESQDGQIGVTVRVDIDRIGPGDVGEIRAGLLSLGESKFTCDRALIHVESGRTGSAGEVEIRFPVIVAVEGGHATTDEERPVAVIGVVDARGLSFLDEVRLLHRHGGGSASARGQQDSGSNPHHCKNGNDARNEP